MDELKELINQYESGLLTNKELWAKIAMLACSEHEKLCNQRDE